MCVRSCGSDFAQLLTGLSCICNPLNFVQVELINKTIQKYEHRPTNTSIHKSVFLYLCYAKSYPLKYRSSQKSIIMTAGKLFFYSL